MNFFLRFSSAFQHLVLQRIGQSERQEFCPNRWVSTLLVGLTTGTLGVLFDLSFATLIFSSSLSNYLSAGVGLILFSAAATRVMIALMSSFPPMVADLGTVQTAILAWSVGMVVKQLPVTASSTELLITVIVTIASTSVLTGLFLFGLGALKLGNLVRSLPYPVVGGFVASTGWLLVKGAVTVMTDQSLGLGSLPRLSQAETLIQWLPGLLLAACLLAIAHRWSHPLAMSSSLLAAIGLFYLFLPLMGSSIHQVGAQGLTLNVPTFQTPWQLLSLHDLQHVHWNAIWGQWMCTGTVIVTTAINLMMNVKGMELISEREIDTNHELKVAGMINIITGFAGGILSFQSMNKSVLAYKMGGRDRLATLIGAAMFIILPVLGSPLLAYFPKPILGGLLLYLGLSILLEWVYRAWKKLSTLDYAIVQMIWIVSGTVGFLQGLAVGWGLAMLLGGYEGLRRLYRMQVNL